VRGVLIHSVGWRILDGSGGSTFSEEPTCIDSASGLSEILRPVNAHEFTLEPGAIVRVFNDNVELFAGLLVIVSTNIEVGRDFVSSDDCTGRFRGELELARSDFDTRKTTLVSAGRLLVRTSGEQPILCDFPSNSINARAPTDGSVEVAVICSAIDIEGLRTEFGVVAVVLQALAKEEVFV